MNEVMLDLETMGTSSHAAIVAIGAVEFDRTAGTIGETFYSPVSLKSSMKSGGVVDADTVTWWLKQDDGARKLFSELAHPLSEVLSSFAQWCMLVGDARNLKVWGNGSDFDNVILANSYERLEMLPPWKYYNSRCFRTAKEELPLIQLARSGVKHNALDDALYQAQYLIKASK